MITIIGSGPIGLATGIALQQKNIPFRILERGCLANAIYNYPVNMTFFSTSDRLEIGNVPFISHGNKPTRREALEYYRRVSESFNLPVHLYEEVLDVEGKDEKFTVRTSKGSYKASKVVLATGFYGRPKMLDIPGENLPKVKHYYDEPHPYSWQKVLVIGGGNSAVDAALETYRSGAEVSMVVRGPKLRDSVKYWVKPDIENRIKAGEISGYFNTRITAIREKEVDLLTSSGKKTIKNDFVLAMTGYIPHFDVMRDLGIEISRDETKKPVYNETSLETNRKGLYVAGVVCGGMDTSSLFIENSRVHAEQIANDIEQKL
ncbi:MAG: YpdA family putative bacillithiol disulfide reductase [Balneolaceae bacterium]